MGNLVKRMLCYLAALTLCGIVAAAPGHAKEKVPSKSQARGKTSATKQQARLIDSDGYRLVSPNSTMRCAQTLRGTLDCRE